MEIKPSGRKAFSPTAEQRALVASSPAGTTRRDLAEALGISVPTLRKAFAAEIGSRTSPAPRPEVQPTLFTDAPSLPQPPAPPPARPLAAKAAPRTGRPRYAPTDRDKETLMLMLATGETLASVALVLGVSEPTLRRACAREIDTAAARKRAEALMRLERQSRNGSTSATVRLLERFDRAALDEIQRGMQAPLAAPAKAPALGKKEQAQKDADRVLIESEWADLLPKGSA